MSVGALLIIKHLSLQFEIELRIPRVFQRLRTGVISCPSVRRAGRREPWGRGCNLSKNCIDHLFCCSNVESLSSVRCQPPPQALRFSHCRGERERSDWLWTARDHGKGTDGRLPLRARFKERRLGTRQVRCHIPHTLPWTGLWFLTITKKIIYFRGNRV